MSERTVADRLAELTIADEHRLRRRQAQGRAIEDRDLAAAERRVAARRSVVPVVRYPEELPITARRDDLLAALSDHQVVIVAGETGSGKSTQLPKLCLELGRGVRGTIGHTQPRRIAARTVAERVAEEVGSEVGGVVGYTVRFTDRATERTLVKVMTDGILLAEIQRDRRLERYDTLIIDEAHERSLNIDFILGYLKQLLPERPDLKVVVTSATIDTERFARHFDGAPVVEVSGRTYPVEVRYRPLVDDGSDEGAESEPRDQVTAICEAVDELEGEGPGDVLVFLSGEREIRDTADALDRRRLRDTEVVPLYGRLSAAEQHRVFEPHTGRRIVLATNVAETSLTVPGIRYVVDPGTARISRFNRRTKVQRLPIEEISQASANQRAGRCGRVAPGICIRLYSEDDFSARPEFTDPEILRTNLASVILQMTAIGLGDIAAFPFVEPPDARSIKDGVALLEELGAFEAGDDTSAAVRRLTPVGRRLARLPVDPRLGRMILEADRRGCVAEVLVIAAGLSIQDPRERPEDRREVAQQSHARFHDPDSDFLTYLRLWDHLREAQAERSSSQFRKLCRTEYLNYLRVREWQDLHGQLRQIARELDLRTNTEPAHPDHVHQALLAGLLSHVGMRHQERQEYLGARNARFAIAPGSALFKKPPRWVMASELVETNRMWGRVVARIQPEWAERAGAHLVRRSYTDPWWDADRGAAMTNERVTLYGLPLVTARRVSYARVDPADARAMFLQHALVEGEWRTHHAFVKDNRRLVEQVRSLEDRVRRRDLLRDDEAQLEFYDARVGPDVVSGRHFDAWWKRVRTEQPDLLTFTAEDLLDPQGRKVRLSDFPDTWRQGELELPLDYTFAPGDADDGVTVFVPLPVLNRVKPVGFDWHVPGFREELLTALLRSLPKTIRRHYVPVPDYVAAILDRFGPEDGPLLPLLERELPRMTGDPIPPGSWQLDRVPDHLRITFRVLDEEGRTVATGKDLAELHHRLGAPMRSSVAAAASAGGDGLERSGMRSWECGSLPRVVERQWGANAVRGYPALADEGESVAVRVVATPEEQDATMWSGTRRLLLLTLPSPAKAVLRLLPTTSQLALASPPHGSMAALLDDCTTAVIDDALADAGGPAWDEAGFDALRESVRQDLVGRVLAAVEQVAAILATADAIALRLDGIRGANLRPAADDVAAHVRRLVHAGFVTNVGVRRLDDVLRYLRADERRLDRLAADPARDRDRMQRLRALEQRFDDLVDRSAPAPPPVELVDVEWLLEELRVSYFAQGLGTAQQVSEKRIARELERLGG